MWYRSKPEDVGKRKAESVYRSNTKKVVREREKEEPVEGLQVKAVIFVQETENGELINKLRETEEKLAETSGYRVKLVERCGEKLIDTTKLLKISRSSKLWINSLMMNSKRV